MKSGSRPMPSDPDEFHSPFMVTRSFTVERSAELRGVQALRNSGQRQRSASVAPRGTHAGDRKKESANGAIRLANGGYWIANQHETGAKTSGCPAERERRGCTGRHRERMTFFSGEWRVNTQAVSLPGAWSYCPFSGSGILSKNSMTTPVVRILGRMIGSSSPGR